MRGTEVYADLIRSRYTLACKRLGLNRSAHTLDTSRFSPPITRPQQLTLW